MRNGGGLVATCETSLFDELGQPRHNFALADLFGVDYEGARPRLSGAPIWTRTSPSSLTKNTGPIARGRRKCVGAGDLLTGELVADRRLKSIVEGVQASFKGPLVQMSNARPPMKRAMIMFPEGRNPIPAVVMGEQGKGRVVYMAAGFDAANYSYCYPYQRVIFATAMKWAAREPPPVAVDAPMCIQSTVFRQKDAEGERLVVHLFNGINTASDHGLPEADVPLREEVVPVGGIKVRFHKVRPMRVHLEPEGVELAPVQNGEWTEFSIPPLAVHSMVVAEL